ncbi:MAG TPA: phosphatidylserine decarboxylase family protein [Bacteroidales bacterium]|nr:phosphatidylserine decarboxylase family protein [Bacteroidales bacterium]
MKIHKEGYSTIVFTGAVLSLILLFLHQKNVESIILYPLSLVFLAFFIFIISFFRNPKRVFTYNTNAIIAPADGKIVVIEEVEETEYLHCKCRQISIFMSPLNVHINRYPCSGTVIESIHHSGKKLPAFNPKSSTENERTTIVMETHFGTIVFRQIAGAVARRIVNYAQKNDIANQNSEFGFIKFGSRVDIFIPLTMEISVSLNQIVWGGQTILATK